MTKITVEKAEKLLNQNESVDPSDVFEWDYDIDISMLNKFQNNKAWNNFIVKTVKATPNDRNRCLSPAILDWLEQVLQPKDYPHLLNNTVAKQLFEHKIPGNVVDIIKYCIKDPHNGCILVDMLSDDWDYNNETYFELLQNIVNSRKYVTYVVAEIIKGYPQESIYKLTESVPVKKLQYLPMFVPPQKTLQLLKQTSKNKFNSFFNKDCTVKIPITMQEQLTYTQFRNICTALTFYTSPLNPNFEIDLAFATKKLMPLLIEDPEKYNELITTLCRLKFTSTSINKEEEQLQKILDWDLRNTEIKDAAVSLILTKIAKLKPSTEKLIQAEQILSKYNLTYK